MSEDLVLDYEAAMNRVDNDSELFFELIDMFFDDAETSTGAVGKAIGEGDAEKLKESAHSIKSALGNLGAMRAYRIAYDLEIKGRDGNLAGAKELFDTFMAEIEKFKGESEKVRAAKA